MADIDAEIESLRAELARLQAEPIATPTPTYSFDVSTPARKAAVSTLGGVLGVGDVLFNLPSNIAAGGSALYESLIGGQPFLPEFQARREQLAQAKELYRQQAKEAGLSLDVPLLGEIPVSELGAAVAGPVPKALIPVKGAGLLTNLGKVAGTGAGLGALQAGTAVETPPEQATGAAITGALIGGGLGAGVVGLPVAAKAPGKMIDYALSEIGLGSKQRLVRNLNEDAAKLAGGATAEPSTTIRPYGEQLKTNIKQAADKAKQDARTAFEDPEVYNAETDVRGIRKGIKNIFSNWQRTAQTEVQDSNLNEQIKKLLGLRKPATTEVITSPIIDPSTGAPVTTTQIIPAVNTANLGTIHEIQVAIGESLPQGAVKKATPDQALALQIYNYLNDIIDKTPGSEKLQTAKGLWKEYSNNFVWNPTTQQRSPLKAVRGKSPEKVINYLSGTSQNLDIAQKAPGVDVNLIKNQKLNEFAALPTAEEKLKWIRKNGPALETSSWWAPFEEYRRALEGTLAKEGGRTPTTGIYDLTKNLIRSAIAPEPTIPTTRFNRTFLQGLLGERLTQGLGSVASQLPESGTSQLTAALLRQLNKPGMAAQQTTDAVPPTQTGDIDIQIESLRKELETLRTIPETTAKPTQISALIEKQPPLIRAIIDVESKGKPAAKSGKGATGLMQLLPSTAEALGVDPKDPAQNIEGGTKYLAQMKEKFKNEKLALAAYNWGPGNLQRAIAKTQKAGLKATWENILRTTFVPKETRQYVSKVLTLKNKYSV